MSPVRTLFVGSFSRSGSTLLGAMLHRVPGFFWAGEVRWIWWRCTSQDTLCGCGVPFAECPFWTEVGRVAFGGWNAVDLEDTIAVDQRLVRFRYVPRLLAGRRGSSFERRIAAYEDRVARLYQAIQSVSDCRVVVDTTKLPPYAFFLRRLADLDLRLAHLVRDSRGVAFSRTKRLRRPETAARTYLRRSAPWVTALAWDAANLALHAVGMAGVPRLGVQYGSLVASPGRELARIAEFCDVEVPVAAEPALAARQFTMVPNHAASGNPMRFAEGPVTLREDEAWRKELSMPQRLAVDALTLPLLVGYGYVGRRSASS